MLARQWLSAVGSRGAWTGAGGAGVGATCVSDGAVTRGVLFFFAGPRAAPALGDVVVIARGGLGCSATAVEGGVAGARGPRAVAVGVAVAAGVSAIGAEGAW